MNDLEKNVEIFSTGERKKISSYDDYQPDTFLIL